METDPESATRPRRIVSRRDVRIVLGVLWLVDAALQAAPALFTADWWRGDLAQSVMGEPLPINRSIFWAVGIVADHPTAWNATFVALQALLGLALILGRFERTAIVVSVGYGLGIWWIGEGFGGLPTGFALLAAGSPGPVVFYLVLGLLAWPRRDADGREQPRTINAAAGLAGWVLLWAGQAVLHLPLAFPAGQVARANIEEPTDGEPHWLTVSAGHLESFAATHGTLLAAGTAAVEIVIGLGVLSRRTRRPALVAGIVVALVYWVFVQDLGTLLAGDATDPGSGPLLVLYAVALWPIVGSAVPARSRARAPMRIRTRPVTAAT
jgi:hypothetical protein